MGISQVDFGSAQPTLHAQNTFNFSLLSTLNASFYLLKSVH